MAGVLPVGGVGGGPDLPAGDAAELPVQNLLHPLFKGGAVVDAQVIVDEFGPRELRAVARQDLGVVGDDGAVIVVLALALVDVVAHAGVEDGIQAQL